MRRAVLTLGGTVAGLVALFSFKTHSLAGVSALEAPNAPAAATSASASSSPSSPSSPSGSSSLSVSGSASAGSPGDGAGPGSGAGPATRIVTGAVATTQYGPMQIQLTLAGQRITKVTVLQHTDDGSESMQVDAAAIPRLTSETLVAQNAHIDAVSGASYTSAGYIQSLQSALDQAAG
jgi:FMN-binding domain